ncbi:hypothetical protein ANN_06953 [Periplaneta americana]|uniref:Uncharacterized protein n=1 Tax=Periplaneta americana TaxID=6978 RepID=A0ABQ8TFP5_PERAM|nr:hypothetical protein ANN_06953 [Periplaneta americana]
MAGLCEGGNEPPGSLKASKTGVVSTEHAGASLSYPRKTQCTIVLSVAASGYALYLSVLHDGAHWTAPRTLCIFQRVLTTTALESQNRDAAIPSSSLLLLTSSCSFVPVRCNTLATENSGPSFYS